MTSLVLARVALLAASSATLLAIALSSAPAQQPPPSQAPQTVQPTPAPAPPPGFSAIDVTKPAASQQDQKLAPHPTPPTVTAVERLPVDKLKLPTGFKCIKRRNWVVARHPDLTGAQDVGRP